MPYCPNCAAEYEDWATVCADCGRPLAPGGPPAPPPPAPRADLGDYVYVMNVPNAIIGGMLVDQLQQAGIPAMLRRNSGADIGDFSHYDYVAQDILAPASLAAQARQY